jgi:exodeoxyribonuclease V beta subunit
MTDGTTSPVLDLLAEPIGGTAVVDLAIEASAGTGKTYSLTALFARLVAENEAATVDRILVVTFTRNAAASLRARIREQLAEVLSEMLEPKGDQSKFPCQLTRRVATFASDAQRRIEAALASLDTANIMTIDSFCAQVLRLGGVVVNPEGAGQEHAARISRAVNDEALRATQLINEKRYKEVLTALLQRSMAEPRFEPTLVPPPGSAEKEVLDRLERLTNAVRAVSDESVDFDEAKRRAAELLSSGGAVLEALARQLRFVFIDEAQDTDWKQWELFDVLWRAIKASAVQSGEGAARVFVGDPKQSIYGFRGADVAAYVHQIEKTKSAGNSRVLGTNYRSDPALLAVLNDLLAGTSYGPSASYESVVPGSAGKQLAGSDSAVTPVTLVECDSVLPTKKNGGISYKSSSVVEPAAARVVDLLTNSTGIQDDGTPTAFGKSDFAVLTRSGANARAIQRQLLKWNVPAVSNSTSSVADSDAFVAWLSLAGALERPSDEGRVRRCLLSSLFGLVGHDPQLQKPDFIGEKQELMEKWRAELLRDGVVALALSVLAEHHVNRAFLSGPFFLRRLTDFNHIVELVSESSRSRGITPYALTEALEEIAALESMDETAARRVESDDDAVQVMTAHAAKGLEFPVVVVADVWTLGDKPSRPRAVSVDSADVPAPARPETRQWLEAAWANESELESGEGPIFDRELSDRLHDKKRLFYVAVTRAKHSLSILTTQPMGQDVPPKSSQPIFCLNLDDVVTQPLEKSGSLQRVDARQLEKTTKPFPKPAGALVAHSVSQSHRPIMQTSDRVSYSDLVNKLSGEYDGQRRSVFEELIRQQDELSDSPEDSAETGDARMPLWGLPAGGHVGDAFHKVFEHLDVTAPDFDSELLKVVGRYATQDFMLPHHECLIEGLKQVCDTPLGPELGNMTLRDVDPRFRVAEMRFDAAVSVGMPGDAANVAHIGEFLVERLGPDDPLRSYGEHLKSAGEELLIRGILNGSIDKIIPVGSGDSIRFYISDYKSNKVSTPINARPVDRYTPENLNEVMREAHYPLQALLYGVALHRYLRWRAPNLDADAAIGGWSYLFLRGMLGNATQQVEGGVHGVSTWSSRKYPGFWSGLSAILMGRSR